MVYLVKVQPFSNKEPQKNSILVGYSTIQKGSIFGTFNEEKAQKQSSQLSDDIYDLLMKKNYRSEEEFRKDIYKKVEPDFFNSFDITIIQGDKTILKQKGVLPSS